jgi:hypothetical protein
VAAWCPSKRETRSHRTACRCCAECGCASILGRAQPTSELASSSALPLSSPRPSNPSYTLADLSTKALLSGLGRGISHPKYFCIAWLGPRDIEYKICEALFRRDRREVLGLAPTRTNNKQTKRSAARIHLLFAQRAIQIKAASQGAACHQGWPNPSQKEKPMAQATNSLPQSTLDTFQPISAQAVFILARLAAKKAVKEQLRGEGRRIR